MPSVFNNHAVLEFKFKFDILKVCFKISFFLQFIKVNIPKTIIRQQPINGCVTGFMH